MRWSDGLLDDYVMMREMGSTFVQPWFEVNPQLGPLISTSHGALLVRSCFTCLVPCFTGLHTGPDASGTD